MLDPRLTDFYREIAELLADHLLAEEQAKKPRDDDTDGEVENDAA